MQPSPLIQIQILCLSDIHIPHIDKFSNFTSSEHIEELKKYVKQNNLIFDYVFVSGDIADLPNSLERGVSAQATEDAMQGLRKLFKEDLEPMARNN